MVLNIGNIEWRPQKKNHLKLFHIRNFTLIELLVVIAIIAILATMLFPSLSKSRELGKRALCLSNERQISIAIQGFSSKNNNAFPVSVGNWGWDDRISPYLGTNWTESEKQANIFRTKAAVLQCPSNPRQKNFKHQRGYGVNSYVPGSGVSVGVIGSIYNRYSPANPAPSLRQARIFQAWVEEPSRTLLAADFWRTSNWNNFGDNSAQLSGWQYSRLIHNWTAPYAKALYGHDGEGGANMVMCDGSAKMMNGKTLLRGASSVPWRMTGSWLSYKK